METQPVNDLLLKLKGYKKKYYTNVLLKGSILCLSAVTAAFVTVSVLEYIGEFNTPTRATLFFSLIGVAGFSFIKWVALPIKQLLNIDRELSDEEASRQIGYYFPEVKDKLLNTLQLSQLNYSQNQLVLASITQRNSEIQHVPFTEAIRYQGNVRYLKRYLVAPLALLLLLFLINSHILTDSTTRIVNYNNTYTPSAPFIFSLQNPSLQAFKGDDLTLNLTIDGQSLPAEVYLVSNGRKHKMSSAEQGQFSYTYSRLTAKQNFHFEAAGYSSTDYDIQLLSRPVLRSFKVKLNYPKYLGRKAENLENIGSLTIPEGTGLAWNIETEEANTLNFNIQNSKSNAQKIGDNQFKFNLLASNSQTYEIQLNNSNSANKDKIQYNLNVIKDKHPSLTLEQFEDTVLYNYLLLGGSVSDDYGLSKLRVYYAKKSKKGNLGKYAYADIQLYPNQNNQNYFYQLNIDSLHLNAGEDLEYYIKVWDNDGVNGAKSTTSQVYTFSLPDKEAIKENLSNSLTETSDQFQKAMDESAKLNQELKQLKEKLKTKRELNWQDKKDINTILEQHKELNKNIEKLQKQFNETTDKMERFEKPNEELSKKLEQLDKLMEEMLDEETKKLMEELQKLLEENTDIDKFNEQLEQLEEKNETMEKELDRTIEMYKQLQFDRKLEEAIEDLKELAEEQQELSEETKEGDTPKEELQQKQEELNKKFEDVKKEMDDLEKINKTLENKKDMEDLSKSEESIDQKQQESSDQLQKGQKSKASKSQEDAAKKMEEMAQQMASMKQDMQEQQAQENLDDLRDILENLVTLSFDQEELMKEFQKVKQTDPRFVTLSQEQLKLKDDAQIIEDSLYALAKRVFEIQSFVTREVTEMKGHMDKSSDYLKQRKPGEASSEQQFAMTSMNNLALLLDDVMDQMQQQMAQQKPGDQMCNKPGQNPKPGKGKLGDQQKQLNDMIKQLKNGQKSGRELSQQLAKMAAQQEMIRRAMQEMKNQKGQDGKANQELGEQLKRLEELMEETEKDLVNKQLSEKTIKRQEDIVTRLLEAEKASRERDLDEKRESQTAKQINREAPKYDESYIKEKERQIELLKTIPPNLNPYYKHEVNEYFQSIEN